MLNRLFIAIGVLVILAIGAAFVAPSLISWADYRGRLEAMATGALGTPVAIAGDIHLTLLPQPQIELNDVRVGSTDKPAMQVAKVQAQFSLMDFLGDHYKVTRLELDKPVVDVAIGADGTIAQGLAIADAGEPSKVSIANADVVDGTIHLSDARSGKVFAAEKIGGQLRLDSLQGPFGFQGTTALDGAGYAVRVASGKLDPLGAATLSLYLKADDSSFTLESSGMLQTGSALKYAGDVSYRRPPPAPKEGETADIGRGDFVLEGKLEAGTDKLVLTTYNAVPDENRSAARLTGAAELTLGKDMAFKAVISGGVVALPPRDATKELTDPPYELVRLLGETPLPPIPPVPGTINLDVAELNLRAVSLRNLRLDARTDGTAWTINTFSASLPGNATLGLTGDLSVVDGKPIFDGKLNVDAGRLDLLAQIWRKPAADNPLFNMAGSLNAGVALSSDTLTLSSGVLAVDGTDHAFDAAIGFGPQRLIKLDAHLGALSAEQSTALAALLPDIAANGSFGTTFPKGEISLSADKAVVFGLDGTSLAADAIWEGGVLEFSKLSAADLGGASFDAKLTAFGTLQKPEISGTASLKVGASAPMFLTALNAMGAPAAATVFLGHSLPADLTLQLDAPTGEGTQALNMAGKLGTADAKLGAKFSAGIVSALTAPVSAQLDLESADPKQMTAQLGFGDLALFDEGTPLHLSMSVDSGTAGSYATKVTLTGGPDHLTFAGSVQPGDYTKIAGTGDVDAVLSDPGALVGAFGADGVYVPAVSGKAKLDFSGLDSVKLSAIDANGVTGDLALTRLEGKASVAGSLKLDTLDVHALLPALGGASSTVSTGTSLWPDGPIDLGSGPRSSEGRIDVAVGSVTANGAPLLTNASFGLDWDAQGTQLRDLSAKAGGGTLSLDANVCCANPALPSKEIKGRLALHGVGIDALLPAGLGASVDGAIEATAEFDGTGTSLSDAMAAMTGSGSYTISNFSVAHFDPATFDALGARTDVYTTEPDALAAAVVDRVSAQPFAAPTVTGSFTIAGGVLRSPNVSIAGSSARVFGGASVSLKDLTIDARYEMSPLVVPEATSALDGTSAEIGATVTGPLWAPVGSYDVAALVEGMKIKANEVELALLEQRKAEADARAKAEAEAEAAAAAASKASEEAASSASAEAAASSSAEAAASSASQAEADRLALEEAAAAQKAADDAAKKAAASSSSQASKDLGM